MHDYVMVTFQTVWTKIMPDKLPGLIWIKTVSFPYSRVNSRRNIYERFEKFVPKCKELILKTSTFYFSIASVIICLLHLGLK